MDSITAFAVCGGSFGICKFIEISTRFFMGYWSIRRPDLIPSARLFRAMWKTAKDERNKRRRWKNKIKRIITMLEKS